MNIRINKCNNGYVLTDDLYGTGYIPSIWVFNTQQALADFIASHDFDKDARDCMEAAQSKMVSGDYKYVDKDAKL